MQQHISFPSIGQFNHVIKHIKSSAKYHDVPVPKVKFIGTVKLHGTNFGICRPIDGDTEDIYFQSRERIITPLSDNAGSASWGYQHRQKLNELFNTIRTNYRCLGENDDHVIQLFGEWAGGNIQKGVGLNKVDKQFFLFAIRISKDAAATEWLSPAEMRELLKDGPQIPDFKFIHDFKTWEIVVDFEDPKQVQNDLIEITENVEADCPVARTLVGDSDDVLIGEGVVWTAVPDSTIGINLNGICMKVKGKLHSASKVKSLAPVDTEKVASIAEFSDRVLTESRLKQGLDKLREMGLEATPENTGTYLKWVCGDVFKEELDTLLASGLTTKDVAGKLSVTARNFYLKVLNDE